MRSILRLLVILAPVLIVLVPSLAQADQAVVVGINSYPNLPTANQLAGCVNDADDVTARLQKLGFQVTEVTDVNATSQNILSALQAARTSTKPNERFIFYFAGHGAQKENGAAALLASDADPVALTGVIPEQDLHNAVANVPARTRTIVLDSCYSGAMSLSLSKGITELTARYYNFYGVPKTKRIVLANPNRPDPATSGQAGDICYFDAAQFSQSAWEGKFGGRPSGVFTHFLLQRLQSLAQSWSALQADVAGDVLQATAYAQSPIVSPGYMAADVFEAPEEIAKPRSGKSLNASAHRPTQSLWETFGEDRLDSTRLVLRINPSLAEIAENSNFTLSVDTPASTGFLVVLEIDTDGDLDLLYPASRKADDGKIDSPSLRLPTDSSLFYSVNETGVERVKAILFRSQQDAQSLLSQFPAAQGDATPSVSVQNAKSHSVTISDTSASPFCTSELSFAVIPAGQD
jgi:hypothetical protein